MGGGGSATGQEVVGAPVGLPREMVINFFSMELEDCLISLGISFDARNVILWF